MSRLQLREITVRRILSAGQRRLNDVPHGLAWRFSSEAETNRSRLVSWGGRFNGERCVLLANGPSLANMDLSKIKDEFSIGMNRIYLNFPKMGFATSAYVAVNELVIEQFGDEIKALQMPKFLNWNRRSYVGPVSSNTHFLRIGLSLDDPFSTDVTRPVSSGGTVTYVALQLAYYMGFQQVVLIGLDHRFDAKGTPNQSETRTAERDANHFHPNYFPKGSKWQLPDLRRSELAYARARQAYEANGREIIDATVDGACAVFRKARFEDLF